MSTTDDLICVVICTACFTLLGLFIFGEAGWWGMPIGALFGGWLNA